MADFARELRRVLKDGGCHFVRQGRGDHEIWYSPITERNITVDGTIPPENVPTMLTAKRRRA